MSSRKNQKYNLPAVLKYTGAFMAWVIGAGFATGQEILQFFSSYGYAGYGVVALNLAGFLILGRIIITTGYDHQGTEKFSHFAYFCGNKLGTLYTWLIPVTLVLLMSVLTSGLPPPFLNITVSITILDRPCWQCWFYAPT
ncbi:MAG: hypothetical protein RQM92_11910 [Candidatus Syntrophopropionicum ammoniitolerans]